MYSKQIDKATCIFCGAPLTSDSKCNYCSCEYITQKQYEKKHIKLPDIIKWESYQVNILNEKHFDNITYKNMIIPIPHFKEISVEVLLDNKYFNDVIALYFNNDCFSKRNIEIKYKKHLITLEQTFIEQYHIHDLENEKVIGIKLIPGNYYITGE